MGRKRNDEKIQVVNIRMVKEPSIYSESRISCPEDAVKAIAKDMATYDREVFAVMNLKTNGQIINLNICSMGTLDASIVSPREVFKSSILSNAASFIAIHLCEASHKWIAMNDAALLSMLDLKTSLGLTIEASSVPMLQIFRLMICPFVLRFITANTSLS